MTQPDQSATADSVDAAPATRAAMRTQERPMTRKERREQERARVVASRSTTSVQIAEGSAPIYRTRREMREAATRLARTLPVTRAEDAEIELPLVLPSFAFGASSVPTPDSTGDATTVPEASRDARPAEGEPRADREADVDVQVAESDVVAPSTAAEPEARDDAADADTRPAPQTAPTERIDITQPRSTGDDELFASVDDVVSDVLGPVGEPERPAIARRPLGRATASMPVRARTSVASRQARLAPPSRPRRARKGHGVLQRLMAGGAIVFIGSLVAVTSLPAEAFTGGTASPFSVGDAQASVAAQSVSVDEAAHGAESASFFLGTDDLTVNDAIASQVYSDDELASLQAVADGEAIGDYYNGSSAMPEVWAQLETDYTQSPFPSLDEVPISSGFGYRWGSFHGGVDMIPGAGTPIYPIANGVVTAVFQGNHPGGGGYMVIVEHNIDGEFYQSWYPHMEAGSIQVEAGQVVDISTQLGAVGSTGNSTGAHLHLEIKNADYTSIDPLVWLQTREEVLEPTN